MFAMSSRRWGRRRGAAPGRVAIAVIAGVVLTGFVTVAPVAAGKTPLLTDFTSNGRGAGASSDTCVDLPDGTRECEAMSVDGFRGTIRDKATGFAMTGARVCVSQRKWIELDGFLLSSIEAFGCRDRLSSKSVTIQRLSTAHIATTVTVQTYACGETDCTPMSTRQIRVDLAFRGNGTVEPLINRSVFDDGSCRALTADRTFRRDATVSGTIDGKSAAFAEAALSRGLAHYRATLGCSGDDPNPAPEG